MRYYNFFNRNYLLFMRLKNFIKAMLIFQLRCNSDNSSITFLFKCDEMNSSTVQWNARTSKQKWEQVNLRNFQGVKVQISSTLIPDTILIPSHTHINALNPNLQMKLSRISHIGHFFELSRSDGWRKKCRTTYVIRFAYKII